MLAFDAAFAALGFELVEDQRRIMGAVGAAGLLSLLKVDRSAPGNRLQPPSSAFRPVRQATAALLAKASEPFNCR
jgi:hypothetical protein